MKKPNVVLDEQVSDLEGLPGVGAVRRAALAIAGITTRAAFARATVEQLISITGIQRAYALKALDIAKASANEIIIEVVPITDEALPDHDGMTVDVTASEASAPEPEPPFDLDLAIFKATTALADASRRYQDSPTLTREFIRFAKLLARLPEIAAPTSKKRKAQIAGRLDRITIRLEKAANRDGKTSKSTVEKLRENLRADRDVILDIVAGKANSKAKDKK